MLLTTAPLGYMDRMAERIDVLGSRPGRLAAFRGRMLDPGNDRILDAITTEAARELGATRCMVSLALERLLIVRANQGAEQLAVDRDISLCQYVVRDRDVVAITDANLDGRVPQIATREHGVGSYLGAPVWVRGEVVGSLCIVDATPREFGDHHRQILLRHAGNVSARLAELAAEQRGTDSAAALLRVATRPVFQDLRNAVWQLSATLDEMRVASAEAQRLGAFSGARVTLADGSEVDFKQLAGAVRAASDLQDLTDHAQRSADRMQTSILALEAAAQGSGNATELGLAVKSAARLAEHFVKLVGGVSGLPLPHDPIEAAPAAAVVHVGTALATLSQALLRARAKGPLHLSSRNEGDRVTLCIAAPAEPSVHAGVAAELGELLGPSAGVTVGSDAGSISLTYRRCEPAA